MEVGPPLNLAERVGFEPTEGLLPHRISSAAPSTTQPPFLLCLVIKPLPALGWSALGGSHLSLLL